MERLTSDVSKWHCHLRRSAVGEPQATSGDGPWERFADELYERLYTGGEALPESAGHKRWAGWGKKLHEIASALPEFGRLAAQVGGDAPAAATAATELAQALSRVFSPDKDAKPEALRKAMRKAVSGAVDLVDEIDEDLSGLDGCTGWLPGHGRGRDVRSDGTQYRAAVQRLRSDKKLAQIAKLAGRFRRIAAQKQREKVKHAQDEIVGVETGDALARLLPSELGKLLHPLRKLALMRDLVEKSAMQYALSGSDTKGQGPIVVCLDKSTSMAERGYRQAQEPDVWASAVALALYEIAVRQKRAFAVVTFTEYVTSAVIVKAGDPVPAGAIFRQPSGGTNIAAALFRALDLIGEEKSLGKADVILITDGGSDITIADEYRKQAREKRVTTYGVGIGVPRDMLLPWCDQAIGVERLDTVEESVQESIFSI